MGSTESRTVPTVPVAPAGDFDERAQSAFAARFRTCPPEEFIRQIEAYVPRTPAQRTVFELYRGWALFDAGRDLDARHHLIVALPGTRPGSAQRSLVRGLLCEGYLRKGQFLRAERCIRRALAEGCHEDWDQQFGAGHRFMLGRIQRFLGHLSHAKETFEEALDLAGSGRFRLLILNELAELHLLRGEHEESESFVQACRGVSALGGERGQDWAVALTEVPLALALGDIERAERVAEQATADHASRAGQRVRLVLAQLRAMVLIERGRERHAEALLRGALERSEPGGENSDCVAPTARLLAGILRRRGRLDEAVRMARLAVRSGRFDDRIEWLRALRIEGECLWAKGAFTEARRVFREASSLHTTMQFLAERRLLARTLERLGCSEDAPTLPASETQRPIPAIAPESTQLRLASGQVFVSSDRRLIESIGFAARTDLPVLIEGETGTGKELVARLIHELGPRASRPWVVLDCTTIPETLADAELFGAHRGAYTGAVSDRAGLIAEADGGTLFLDELTELPIPVQAKLLRVLQDGTYRRVGEGRTRRVVVRVVAATNRSAQAEMESGRLKADLFYRLSGHRIVVPPLRARRHEIGLLATEFARRLNGAILTPAALAWLDRHPWPGNVRQLEMLIRLAINAHPGAPTLDRTHLEETIAHGNAHGASLASAPSFDRLSSTRRQGERAALERLLHEHRGVVSEAARQLGISRQAFYKALRRTGLAATRLERPA